MTGKQALAQVLLHLEEAREEMMKSSMKNQQEVPTRAAYKHGRKN
jgi:hypothetical protein